MNKYFVLLLIKSISAKAVVFVTALILFVAPLLITPASVLAAEESYSDVGTYAETETIPAPSPTETTTPQASSTGEPPIVDSSTTLAATPELVLFNETNEAATAQPVDTQESPLEASTSSIVDTTLNSDSTTGSAEVVGTNETGNITTGDATATSTNVTLLQSTFSLPEDDTPILFTYDIVGDINGNLLLPVEDASTSIPLANPSGSIESQGIPLVMVTSADSVISNTINLAAVSGSVMALDNGSIGNILTGDAQVAANLVNIVNSGIVAGGSFIGVVNIYGNLTGDILLPSEILSSAQGIPLGTLFNPTPVSSNTDTTIANTVSSLASSGSISAQSNETIGDISTGNATSNIMVMNMVGSNIRSENLLLIFINVLGTWRGVLLQIPSNTNIATMSGVQEDNIQSLPQSVSLSANTSLFNTINLSAQSGSIDVYGSQKVGNVSTGAAKTGANIVNIVGSNINLNGWFGILFINVFGNWIGNLAEEPKEATAVATAQNIQNPTVSPPSPRVTPRQKIYHPYYFSASSESSTPQLLPDDMMEKTANKLFPRTEKLTANNGSSSLFMIIAGVMALGAGAYGTRYYIIHRG